MRDSVVGMLRHILIEKFSDEIASVESKICARLPNRPKSIEVLKFAIAGKEFEFRNIS